MKYSRILITVLMASSSSRRLTPSFALNSTGVRCVVLQHFNLRLTAFRPGCAAIESLVAGEQTHCLTVCKGKLLGLLGVG